MVQCPLLHWELIKCFVVLASSSLCLWKRERYWPCWVVLGDFTSQCYHQANVRQTCKMPGKPLIIVSPLRTWKFSKLPFALFRKHSRFRFYPSSLFIKFCRRAMFGRRLSPCRRKASPSGDCARILHRAVSACSRHLSLRKHRTRRSGVSLST